MKNKKYYIITLAILIYLFIPLIATFLFSICEDWQTTILPKGLTLKWYGYIFSDVRFLEAVLRSFILSVVALILSLVVMIPTMFISTVYFPRFEKAIGIFSTIPFAIPGVVYAVGLIKAYSSGPINISGTIFIVIGAFFITILPYMYQGIRNSLRTIDVNILMEACELLHASKIQAFIYVILPNIIKGITVSALLSFSILFGEFVLTNLLVGGSYETVQIYLYNTMGKSGHISSSVVIVYFTCILILSFITTKMNRLVNKS